MLFIHPDTHVLYKIGKKNGKTVTTVSPRTDCFAL